MVHVYKKNYASDVCKLVKVGPPLDEIFQIFWNSFNKDKSEDL